MQGTRWCHCGFYTIPDLLEAYKTIWDSNDLNWCMVFVAWAVRRSLDPSAKLIGKAAALLAFKAPKKEVNNVGYESLCTQICIELASKS
jgi:hypothetical protein